MADFSNSVLGVTGAAGYVGKAVTVTKTPGQIEVRRKGVMIAVHPRVIDQRDTRNTLPGHHTIPVRQGRSFNNDDKSNSQPAAIVNEASTDSGILADRATTLPVRATGP